MTRCRTQLIVDRFHLLKRANQTVEAVRRRTTWESRGRRGRKADPNGDILAAWIAKELLRDVLACTATGALRYDITTAVYRF
ncbi:ISMsm4, transposase [Mycobacterium haemophilum DSM 44634]|nr:hypothetical protein B586_19960 [Mycobacterium haemophilum DSM 44634]MCV7340662.1 transposase [Mycobacterium haemophilum DSM 44634]